MDYKLNEKNIAAAFTCLDTVSEQPVDLELILQKLIGFKI